MALARWLVTIFALLTFVAAPGVYGIDDKCAACNAVAEELEQGLSNEKPRNHLDMRHRLDSKGQRRGKVIDYRVSELRVVELLDGLCKKMQDYTLQQIDSNRREWVKVDSWDNLTSGQTLCKLLHEPSSSSWMMDGKAPGRNKQEAQAYSKDISSYCGRLLEETEDELEELIKKGSVKVGGVSKILCQDLSKHCSQSSGSKTNGYDEESDEESDAEL